MFAEEGDESTALELAEHNITVNCYAPGAIATGISSGMRTYSALEYLFFLFVNQRFLSSFGRTGEGRYLLLSRYSSGLKLL